MDAMSETGGGRQREVKIDIQRRRDEGKRREEKSKKRVIHLYAGKDNQLAILTRSTFRGEEMK